MCVDLKSAPLIKFLLYEKKNVYLVLNYKSTFEAHDVFSVPGAKRDEKSDSWERDEGILRVGFFPPVLFLD